MSEEQIAAQILKLVEGWQPMSFYELVNKLGAEAVGEYTLTMPQRPNIILWESVSGLFIDAFNIVKDKLFVEPTSEWIYMMDGGGLNLPIAKHLDYKTPHWVPMAISIRTPELQAEIDAAKGAA